MEIKKEIRKTFLEKRKQIPAEIRREYSRVINERVLRHPFFQCADTILCYMAFREEVTTEMVIEHALKQGKTVGIPKVLGKARMEFYKIHEMVELNPGYQGILEPGSENLKRISFDKSSDPKGRVRKVSVYTEKLPLMILPGAAFDKAGNRIGYGGGFYDAYLQKYPDFHKIGLAFSTQCVERIPAERHDVSVDVIMTELGDYITI